MRARIKPGARAIGVDFSRTRRQAECAEIATGKRAFAGESKPEILSAIIREEPEPIGAVNPKVPAPLRWIVERCRSPAGFLRGGPWEKRKRTSWSKWKGR